MDQIILLSYVGLLVFALNGLVFMAILRKYQQIKAIERQVLEIVAKRQRSHMWRVK